MSIEFASNPVASKLSTFNWKLQFDCTGFYNSPQIVIPSDPYISIVAYNQSNNSFDFSFVSRPQNAFTLNGLLLTSFLLTPPIQSGSPFAVSNVPSQMWWTLPVGTATTTVVRIGAEQNLAGNGVLPDVVLCQIILNADIRSLGQD